MEWQQTLSNLGCIWHFSFVLIPFGTSFLINAFFFQVEVATWITLYLYFSKNFPLNHCWSLYSIINWIIQLFNLQHVWMALLQLIHNQYTGVLHNSCYNKISIHSQKKLLKDPQTFFLLLTYSNLLFVIPILDKQTLIAYYQFPMLVHTFVVHVFINFHAMFQQYILSSDYP